MNIPYNYCLSAINELQANAIDKLKARDLFKDTGSMIIHHIVKLFFLLHYLIPYVLMCLGVATIKVRVPDKHTGGRLITVQLKLDAMVDALYSEIAGKLNTNANM